jgi:tetratricopeptide (TPR) repeat protein
VSNLNCRFNGDAGLRAQGYSGIIERIMSTAPDTLLAQGYTARREHRPDDAKKHFTEAIELCRMTNDPNGLAQALAGLGQIERDLHNGAAARSRYEEATALCRTFGHPLALAHTIRHLGDILREQGELAPAEVCYRDALGIYRQEKETPPLDLANAIRGIALLKVRTREVEEAKSFWREAKELYASLQVQAGVDEGVRYLSLLEQM